MGNFTKIRVGTPLTKNAFNLRLGQLDEVLQSLQDWKDTINTLFGGDDAADQVLVEWTAAEAYQLLTITYDATHTSAISSATVRWPDGSTGTYTATSINGTHGVVDAYTITHTKSGKTVTQSGVTRNAAGLVTNKPLLTVS